MSSWDEPDDIAVMFVEDADQWWGFEWIQSNMHILNILAMTIAAAVMFSTYCLRHVHLTQGYGSMTEDSEFYKILLQTRGQLRKGEQKTSEVVRKDIDKVLDFIRENLSTAGQEEYYSTKTRIVCAEWLVLYFNCGNLLTDRANNVQQPTSTDTDTMWRLVDDSLQYEDEAEEKQAMLVRLDIANAIQDTKKLLFTYMRIMTCQASFTSNELLNVFAIAPVLGHWGDCRSLGLRALKAEPELFKLIHKLAMKRPTIMDFSALHIFARQNLQLGNVVREHEIQWGTYKLISMQTLLKTIRGGTATARMDLQRNLQSSTWNDIPVEDHKRMMIRSGAAVQGVSFSHSHFPLVGVFSDERLSLTGYIETVPGRFTVETLELMRPDVYEREMKVVASASSSSSSLEQKNNNSSSNLPVNPYETKEQTEPKSRGNDNEDEAEEAEKSGEEKKRTVLEWKGVYSIRKDTDDIFEKEHSLAFRDAKEDEEKKKKKRRMSTGSVQQQGEERGNGIQIDYHCRLVLQLTDSLV